MYSYRNFYAKIIEKRIRTSCVDVVYPQVKSIVPTYSRSVKYKINRRIQETVLSLIPEDTTGPNGCIVKVTGSYRITVNEKGIMSIRLEVFTIPVPAANGTTVVRGLTFDLSNGHEYEFYELFRPDSGYKVLINGLIARQITEREIPVIGPVPPVTENQEFYLTENELVVVYPESVFTPHFVGPPEFPIPYNMLAGVINEAGPIGRLLNC